VLYYVVAEGRARRLDRLNLRDRATYGLDWMVFYASSARDALRQWEQFKAGTHIGQKDLELEAARYQERRPGFVAAWEAESQAVASKATLTLEDVEARLRELESERERLIGLRDELRQATRVVVSRPARPTSTIRSRSKRTPKGLRDRRRPAK
jgi:hypothetical protein